MKNIISITSRTNPLILRTVKLQDKKQRDLERCFLLDGIKLFREAIAASVPLEQIFVSETAFAKYETDLQKIAPAIPLIWVPDTVFSKLSEEKSPQGILCVAKYIDKFHNYTTIESDELLNSPIFLLSSVRDPGNLGTILRTASAFHVPTVLLSNDCADIYNPKTIRSAMGALFREKIIRTPDINTEIALLRAKGRNVYATALRQDAIPVQQIKADRKTCFVVGNEGQGLTEETIRACTGSILIPMAEEAESLNVAVASSVLLWEMMRIELQQGAK